MLGGVDIIKEMDEDGSLETALRQIAEKAEGETQAPMSLEERLKSIINKAPVTLFMKGCPDAPKCGFSAKICGILAEHKVEFSHFDILTDEEVRQGLKSYSNWPTYPQLYSGGKLVGGLDIVKELADEGSLLEELGVGKS